LKNKFDNKIRSGIAGSARIPACYVALRGVKASVLNQLEFTVEAFERSASSTQGCVRSQRKRSFYCRIIFSNNKQHQLVAIDQGYFNQYYF